MALHMLQRSTPFYTGPTAAPSAALPDWTTLPLMLRASFRQLLLLAFVLMSVLLGAVSLSGLQALQGLLAKSREAGQQSIQLNLSTRGLAERSTDMERAARQYLVLGDDALRQRFDDAANQAQTLLLPLGQYPPTQVLTQQWLAGAVRVRSQLADQRLDLAAREQAVATEFRALENILRSLTQQVQQSISQRNQEVQDALETQRNRQVQQVLVAIVAAAVAALAFGLWLTRPLRRLGQAIVALGEGRLAEPVNIRGPADLSSLGRQLDWLRLRLTELDEDKARFLRHTSHELKTPLAAVSEAVSLLQEGVGGTLGAEQAEIVGILQHNTSVLQQQIEDLLRYNAAAFDARRLQRRPTPLRSLVEQVVQAQRLSWQARSLSVAVEGDVALVQPVDPERLGAALGNLLSNAIRFSPSGGRIRWWVGTLGDKAVLQISDNGPGVPAADREHIFDPFYRGSLQPQGQARGSGIGLSIVREQVSAHGGQVRLAADAAGACFQILLPLENSHA
ncbi:two-component system, NtrC family, sensor histidine kinase GlrK [Rhodoferax sp. OV413]|nr:two-component system, NtrC family, sensor histidine kinase GlrK [Rhodoferax sp. OV413]